MFLKKSDENKDGFLSESGLNANFLKKKISVPAYCTIFY